MAEWDGNLAFVALFIFPAITTRRIHQVYMVNFLNMQSLFNKTFKYTNSPLSKYRGCVSAAALINRKVQDIQNLMKYSNSVFRRKLFIQFKRQTKISTKNLAHLVKVHIRILDKSPFLQCGTCILDCTTAALSIRRNNIQ